jgi:hypothetical protein
VAVIKQQIVLPKPKSPPPLPYEPPPFIVQEVVTA